MTDKERIEAIEKILNLTTNALSKEIGLKNAQTLYDILKGKHGISKDLADKITVRYFNINKAWLITGEGDMLKEQQQIEDAINIASSQNGGTTIAGNGISVNKEVDKFIDLLKSRDELLRDIVKEKDLQISRLLGIIENSNK